jgi:hypothetical protein
LGRKVVRYVEEKIYEYGGAMRDSGEEYRRDGRDIPDTLRWLGKACLRMGVYIRDLD